MQGFSQQLHVRSPSLQSLRQLHASSKLLILCTEETSRTAPAPARFAGLTDDSVDSTWRLDLTDSLVH